MEEPVPDGEDGAVVAVHRGRLVGVVPVVEGRGDEHGAQRAQGQAGVGVGQERKVELERHEGHRERQVETDRVDRGDGHEQIDDLIEGVAAARREPVEAGAGMVHRVQPPQDRNLVQCPVAGVVRQVGDEEQDDELEPAGLGEDDPAQLGGKGRVRGRAEHAERHREGDRDRQPVGEAVHDVDGPVAARWAPDQGNELLKREEHQRADREPDHQPGPLHHAQHDGRRDDQPGERTPRRLPPAPQEHHRPVRFHRHLQPQRHLRPSRSSGSRRLRCAGERAARSHGPSPGGAGSRERRGYLVGPVTGLITIGPPLMGPPTPPPIGITPASEDAPRNHSGWVTDSVPPARPTASIAMRNIRPTVFWKKVCAVAMRIPFIPWSERSGGIRRGRSHQSKELGRPGPPRITTAGPKQGYPGRRSDDNPSCSAVRGRSALRHPLFTIKSDGPDGLAVHDYPAVQPKGFTNVPPPQFGKDCGRIPGARTGAKEDTPRSRGRGTVPPAPRPDAVRKGQA
ncbi:hypothetical protein FRACA_610001 [Frankia canadensis]|uniref:Uncharacterized protein n=1 Tax=Frankia canadensis TaxID=1836972 RepID=A0A2I2KZP1_9ACTN|nr:hypothetical protein FRACA_610001 [Frankia canadensis]SOU58410.1 hypothetical protein FRACA_610001 [Frankia canadensis]